jgi:hypothetical protein
MVFDPPERDGDALKRAERIVFVRDRFTWSAFLFAPLWMLWHRLWLVLLAYLVVMTALVIGFDRADFGTDARVLIVALIELLIGFEAASLRRWTLRRRGWRELGTVVGDDLESAERRFFDAWVAEPERKSTPAAAPAARTGAPAPDVVGLFPRPGANR